MSDSAIQFIALMILMIVFAVTVIVTAIVRSRKDRFVLRNIPIYRRLLSTIGTGIEDNRPLHLSMGSAGIGSGSTILALAGAEFFYYAAYEVAIGDVSPIITVSDTSAIPLGQDVLRRAYRARARSGQFRAVNTRWYPAGSRSLAFAAAISAMQGVDQVSANLLGGGFGIETALMADASYRHRIPFIAASDQLEGQAVAYALSDSPLIGEELFVASSYLDGRPRKLSIALTVDVMRWLLVGFILVLMILNLITQRG